MPKRFEHAEGPLLPSDFAHRLDRVNVAAEIGNPSLHALEEELDFEDFEHEAEAARRKLRDAGLLE